MTEHSIFSQNVTHNRDRALLPQIARGFMKKYMLMLCALLAFQVNAEDYGDKFRNVQEHGSWVSGDFNADGDIHSRIINLREDGNNFLGMFLEFHPNATYQAEVILSNITNVPTTTDEGLTINCDLRVDTGHIYKVTCRVVAEPDAVHFAFSRGLEYDFLKDCMRGKTLRVKIDNGRVDPLFLNFDLKGFTEAYKRASSRLHYDKPSHYKSPDSAYFD